MNEKEFDYLGITKFHKLGYKGQGITIASREKLTEHGSNVYDILKQVCPEAVIRTKVDFCKDEDFDIYTTSLIFDGDKFKANRVRELNVKDKLLFCAAGNNGNENCTSTSKADFISVGACHLQNGEPKLASYSSRCEHIDFVSFSNIETSYSGGKKIRGTSFSAPLLAGMIALVQCYFLKNRGSKLNYDEMIEFMKINSKDLGEKGRDNKYGHGLFVLPNIGEGEEVNERYNKLEEVPEYARSVIQKLIDKEVIKGNENGDLDLSTDLLRTLVILDRIKIFD